MQTQPQLCQIPKFLTFEYHQNQQLTTTLQLQNITDRVIDYKIKSNKPQLYLVKPMDGSIYNKQSIKIVFKRKQLARSEFQAYLKNPVLIQEKFLVEVKLTEQDMLGMPKIKTQSTIILVKFNLSNTEQTKAVITTDQKRQEELYSLEQRLKDKQKQYERVCTEEVNTIKRFGSFSSFTGKDAAIGKTDLIALVIVFLLIGLAF